jgi:hypothetical protein
MIEVSHLDRLLGWHLLVPPRLGRRVHLQGFPDGAAAHWQRQRNEEVVTQARDAELRIFWDPSPSEVHSGSEGCVVVGHERSIPRSKMAGRDYVLLPPSDPRIVLPLQQQVQLLRGMSMHRPGRRIARLAMTSAKAFARLGFTAPLKQRVLWIAGVEVPDFGGDAVLYLGATDESRKTTILPGQSDSILKHGASSPARAALHREAEALRAMAETNLAGQIPQLIGIYDDVNTTMLQQEYRVRRPRFTRNLRAEACRFLAGMARVGWKKRALSSCIAGLHGFETVVAKMQSTGATVPGHRSHGDFAAWNMSWTKQGLFVFDWEDSVSWAPAYSDAFHFVVAPALHVARNPDPQKVSKVAKIFASEVARAAGLDIADIPLCWEVWLLEQQARIASPLLAQMLMLVKTG